MSATSIIINSTDQSGKAAQKAMTCVNPDATNEQLAALGQMITAAQNHTYGETYRVDKINCDLEPSAPQKTTPTLSASQTQWSAATFSDDGEGGKISDIPATLTYSGDGNFFIETAALLSKGVFSKVRRNGDKVAVQPYYMAAAVPTFPVTFKVGFTETDNYKACSVELTITA